MKNNFLLGVMALTFTVNSAFGQDIPQSQVPSLVLNNFQQAFPKAADVEWEIDGVMYKVEFELGLLGTDHDAWYDKTGKIVKHKEEIAKTDLPQKVLAKINAEYNGYRVEDVKKITQGTKVSYVMELKTISKEWKVVFDADGTVLSEVAD